METVLPRVVIAGMSGDCGKTTLAIGLVAAWRRRGRTVAPFKKGPDYIDAAWLALAAGRDCHNLDTYLQSREAILASLDGRSAGAEAALIEGNRGLYDGVDAAGTHSTASLAKLTRSPVVLVVSCTKTTRTAAAQVLGCRQLDPEVALAGVILNRVGGGRHERVLRDAIRDATGVPVLGAVPRVDEVVFPRQHLGLVTPREHQEAAAAVARAADLAEKHLDLEALWKIVEQAPPAAPAPRLDLLPPLPADAPRIGVIRDRAFQFYYPENLEAIARHGGRVVEFSALDEESLPAVDGLYIGGGFPESHARALAANRGLLRSLGKAAADGLPIFAECGGLIYLADRAEFAGNVFELSGVLPLALSFTPRPRGHGYTEVESLAGNPYFAAGRRLRGHEFHYSSPGALAADSKFGFALRRGHGLDGRHDGLVRYRTLASYTHLHALTTDEWARNLVALAR